MSSDALKFVPFPLPSLARPFGVELWPIFDKLFSSVIGYSPQNFRFVAGETPMSTLTATATMLFTYYVTVLGGRELMRSRPAFKLNRLFMIHNFYLTVISGSLLALFIEQLLPTVWRKGIFFAICDHTGGWTDELVILYYLNYLTKFVELIDTIFLVLKKKPLTFLHTYHHGATALLCYTQLAGITSVSWVPITLNLLVHVVMYFYYFQSARGIRIPWKQYITILQIVQFVIDLGFVYFASWTYFTSTYYPWLPNNGRCAGEEFAAFAGMGILSSYLVLFLSFYAATYKREVDVKKSGKKERRRRSSTAMARQATFDMAHAEVPSVESMGTASPVANGSANGSVSKGPVTRSRRA